MVTCGRSGFSAHSRLIGHQMINEARIDLERLLSIIRKLLQAMVWLFGIGFSALLIVGGMNEKQGALMIGSGLALILLTWLTSKLINWIFD